MAETNDKLPALKKKTELWPEINNDISDKIDVIDISDKIHSVNLPLFWLRAEGINWYGRWETLSLGDGAVIKVCLLSFTSIQGMRSALK